MVDFKFYLNRQGVQGIQGEQGEPGFSPTVSVDTNTASEYKLLVQNEFDSFTTPNLRGTAITDAGGTYVRYDRENEQMVAGEPDYASISTFGVVKLATDADIEGEVETKAITPAQLVDYVSSNAVLQSDIGDYVGDGIITIEQNGQTVGSFSVNQSTNQTIQLTGGTTPGNLVTTNTDQDITGAKYFSNNKLLVTDGNEFGTVAIFDNTIYATTDGGQATGGVLLGGSGNKSLSDGTKIKFYDDDASAYKLADIMHSGNLVGGSNVTITKSSGKYIISSTGGGGGATYTAGDNIDISTTNVISATNVVTLNTNQEISGVKTFTSPIQYQATGDFNRNYLSYSSNAVHVGNGQENLILEGPANTRPQFYDGLTTSDLAFTSDIPNIPGHATVTTLGTVQPDGTTITITSTGVISAPAQTSTATVTTPGIVQPDGTTVIISTTGVISAPQSTNIVTLDTDQVITGSKYFSSDVTLSNNNALQTNTIKNYSQGKNILSYDRTNYSVILGNDDYTLNLRSSQRPQWYDTINHTSRALATQDSIPSVATTTTAGTVIPDGTTITITTTGVISAVGGGGASGANTDLSNLSAVGNSKVLGGYLSSNVTLNGSSITDTNGVLSNFSYADYAVAPTTLNFSTATTWEMVVAFTPGYFGSSIASLISNNISGDSLQIQEEGGYLRYNLGTGSGWICNYDGAVIQEGHQYFKITYDGTDYKFFRSTDGETFTPDGSYTSSSKLPDMTVRIGTSRYDNPSYPWIGTIDLNGCYIKIDGITVWNGINEITSDKVLANDLSNLDTVGYNTISKVSLPSNVYTDMTPSSSGTTYTMPADGWLCLGFQHPDTADFENYGVDVLDYSNNFIWNIQGTRNLANQTDGVIVPVQKTQKVRIYSNNYIINRMRFVYAEGNQNLGH